MTSGRQFCEIDANGCATSGIGGRLRQNTYGNNERCTIRVQSAGTLSALVFDVAPPYWNDLRTGYNDYVDVDGTKYFGRDGPNGHAVAAGSTITWFSDDDTKPNLDGPSAGNPTVKCSFVSLC